MQKRRSKLVWVVPRSLQQYIGTHMEIFTATCCFNRSDRGKRKILTVGCFVAREFICLSRKRKWNKQTAVSVLTAELLNNNSLFSVIRKHICITHFLSLCFNSLSDPSIMFVKKLVEKASIKKPVGNPSDGLKASDVDPRLVFHQGVPSGGAKFAYDNIQKILALSTKDGRIKLFGKDNAQVLLESREPVPSKFLQFIQNQGILINVTFNNHIEANKKLLSDVYIVKEEITCFSVIQRSLFMYIGFSNGNASVLMLDQEPWHVVRMKYTIPLSASYGNSTEESDDTVVTHILPQPAAESQRVLIIFRNGQIILWDIRESRSIFRTGGKMSQTRYNETKKVSSACWVCPFGSKVVVGYNNGELFIWSIPSLNTGNSLANDYSSQNIPMFKFNLGYKTDKISIGSVHWIYAEGKASRLYVMGASDYAPSNLMQVVLLNEHTESRTIKMGLHLSEFCVDMEIISTSSKPRQNYFILLGKSGHVYMYDDNLIERYLLQSQSKSTPLLPKEVVVKLPLADSSITTAKFISNKPNVFSSDDEYYSQLVKNYPPLIPIETNLKDGINFSSANFTGFSNFKNLYITGHGNGAINFWDASCPFFTPILQLKQQSENDFSLSGIPLTELYFDSNTSLLVSGDQSGMVRIYRFKPEPYASNSFMSLTGGTKKGTDHAILSMKLVKTSGAVICMNIDHSSRHLAVGSDQGNVSVINIDGPSLLYRKHIASEISTGIISLQFRTCSLHGFEKNILAVGTKDSSVLALDGETGNSLSTGAIHPKKPSKAIFMQVLDGQGEPITGSVTKDGLNLSEGNRIEDATAKQLYILLCSEKALYVYSFVHAVQGVKKVLYKKKFHSSSCFWASTIYSLSDISLVLLFTSGKVELRSLPELSLIVETSIRGFTYSPPKLKSFSDSQICCSSKGDLVLVNGDQEIFVFSLLAQRNIFRLLDSVCCIYRKERKPSQEEIVPGPVLQKEKKKGIFSSVIKDFTSSKEKHVPLMEIEDPKESVRELSAIFSNANFACNDNDDKPTMDENQLELNIDDIDLEDHGEKRKEQSILGALNKKKLAGKFQSLKGRLKEMKGNNQKASDKEGQQDEKDGALDQIKKKYGFSSSSNESTVAKRAQNKLHENTAKLQGINIRATDMQDKAKSFSSLAKQVLRTAEQDRRSMSLPNFGTGMEAKTGIFDSKTL
ncbi:Syntaxin-binding protein 5, partial [Mucuna pruriens]